MFESSSLFIPTVIALLLGFAGLAAKTRTWWWIPGAMLLAAAGLLTINGLTEPAQPLRFVVVLAQVFGACLLTLLGFALLHGVAAWRDRKARLESLSHVPPQLPRASARFRG